MDIEKLRKDLLENSDPDGPCIEDDLMQDAATALSTLQTENAEMQAQLTEFSKFLCHMTGGLLSKTNYTAHLMISAAEDYQQKVCGDCDLRTDLEQVKRERETAVADLEHLMLVVNSGECCTMCKHDHEHLTGPCAGQSTRCKPEWRGPKKGC